MQKINDIIDSKLIKNFHKLIKRNYLGASCLGDECARRIQYNFLHAEQEIKATTIRTFDIGHVLEGTVAQWLSEAGFQISTLTPEGKQHSFFTAEGRIGGNTDGIITAVSDDLAEALAIDKKPLPWIWENKTMNNKYWNETAKLGLFATRMTYYVQVQLYMAYFEKEHCLFTSLNKDTSELYLEVIDFDSEIAQKYSDRAVEILKALQNNELLPRIARTSDYFTCKMCPFWNVCWNEKDKTE